MSSKDELRAAAAGAATTGLPIVTTLTFDTNGSTMMGVKPAEVASFCQHDLHPAPVAYGANCGVGPSELVATLVNLISAAGPNDIIVAKSNCGVPYFDNGKIRYDGTPELMARYARFARDAGARIIGGCCGTTPEHLASIRAALDGYEPGTKPTMEQIVTELGKISAGAAGIVPHAANSDAGRRRRGRRGGES
jgi:5-methyltetrahydrofolate--homocysteine methyltransferase